MATNEKTKALFEMARNDLAAAERKASEISSGHVEATLRMLDEAEACIKHLKVIVGKGA